MFQHCIRKQITAGLLAFFLLFLTLPRVANQCVSATEIAADENMMLNAGFESDTEYWDLNAGNVLNQNGGFEQNIASWDLNKAVCTWTKGGANNSYGCAFVDVTNGFDDISQKVMLQIGVQYRITCSIKLAEKDGAYTESFATMLFSYDQKKTEYPKEISVNSENWSKFDFIFTPKNDPENYGGLAKMYVRIGPSGQQNQYDYDYYIDDFYCEELRSDAQVSIATPGADGTGKCAKVITAASAPFVPSQHVAMDRNSWYILSAKVKSESGSTTAQFAVRHDNYTVEYVGNEITVTDQWTDIKAYYKSYKREIGEMSGDVFLCVGGRDNQTTLTYYIDDISVRKNTALYINGDFELENDVTGWVESYKDADGKTIWSSVRPQWVSEPTHSGSGAAKIVPQTNNLLRCAQYVHLEKDVWYQVTFWVKLEEGQGDSEAQIIRTQISDEKDTGSMYMASGTPVNDREWTQVSSYFKYNGTNTVADCQLFLRIGSDPQNQVIPFYFDDFSVEPVEPDQITFNGDETILIPQDGTRQTQFSAVATKEFNGITYEFERDVLFFQITDPLPDNVSFSENTLTVQDDTPECELNLLITSQTYPNLQKNVTLRIITELTNLKDVVNQAESIYNEMPEIISGSKERLHYFIEQAAQVVASQPTMEEVSQATAVLEDAIDRFLRAADRRTLEPILEQAHSVYDEVLIGTAPGESSPQNKEILLSAITVAETAYYGQQELVFEEIVELKRTLNDAIYDFQRNLVPYAEFFVDPVNGNDANNGTQKAPFRSIEAARDQVRSVSQNMCSDIVVNLLGGNYDYSDKDLVFTTEDSGKNGFYIVYRAPSGELPVINGGKEIQGWTLYDEEKNIYRAPAGNLQSRQFYVNGVRATRARQDIDASGWTYDDGVFGHTAPAEYAYLSTLNNLSEVELVYYSAWTNPRCRIQSVSVEDDEKLQIEMQQPGWHSIRNKGGSSAKNPWYIENAYEFIDEEGEWYLDSADGYLYYKPRQGEDLENDYTVLAVNDAEMVSITGNSPDEVVRNVLFSGITFSYSTWMRPSSPYGHSDAQNNHLRDPADKTLSGDTLPPSAVFVQYAHSVDFRKCEFSHLGITALKMIRCIQDSNIYENRFYDISGSAINIGEPATGKIDYVYPNNFNYLPANEKYYIRNNDIVSNYIHHTAVEYRSAAAISAGFPIDMEIAYNTISDTAYSGMHIGYGWKSIPTSIMKNNQIHHNKIINVMNTMINDGGGIYTIGPTSGTDENPNLIYENYFEGQAGYGGSIYNDQGSSFWKVERNVSNLSDSPVWSNANQEHRWLNYWSKDNNDMFANENYASDYQLWEDHGQNNFLGKTYYVTDGNWPEKAQNIIDDAGVPEQNQFLVSYIRAYPSIRVETDKLNCTVQFENTLGNPVNAMCMLAIYNEEGILVELEMSDVNIQPGFSQIIKKNFDLKNRQDLTNATVKLLIWEGSSIGSSSYRPLAAAKTVMLKIAN